MQSGLMSEISFTRLQFLDKEKNNLALKCRHAAMPASKCEYSCGTRQSVNSGANGDLIGGRSGARALGQNIWMIYFIQGG